MSDYSSESDTDPWAGDVDELEWQRSVYEREYERMRQAHKDYAYQAGYREGIIEGKDQTMQAGFDDGFRTGSALGVEAGKLVGKLRYLILSLSSFLTRSPVHLSSASLLLLSLTQKHHPSPSTADRLTRGNALLSSVAAAMGSVERVFPPAEAKQLYDESVLLDGLGEVPPRVGAMVASWAGLRADVDAFCSK
ncbi:hypothetical protein H9P43_008759 [Blastocladiella emersonii ATCC 22665]|nr:hypothetical protein H9P43_008759 [Blastocladiella emersonii ATCC 22665]